MTAVPSPEPQAFGTDLRLADGEWHRLHPATPLLRGGVALIAVIGIVIVNLRDVFIQLVIGGPSYGEDPVQWVIDNGFAPAALGILVFGTLVFTVGFYVSWRMSSFRITDEVVEVRSGVLFRTNRRGRLDRIQGVNISRPILARLVGAAKLEVNVAGHDANVQLSYLGSTAADELRREILMLASGSRSEGVAVPQNSSGNLLQRRATELLAPELDPSAAPPESVVQVHLGRLIGSLLLGGFTTVMLVVIAAVIAAVLFTGRVYLLFAFVPGIIGMGGYYVSRFTKSVRYSIAATPDGVRVGFGLLSTTNETIPPGRIHAVRVSQPLLWRPAGWWEVRINRAASSSAREDQQHTSILPVGNLADVRRVLDLVLPGLDAESAALIGAGLTSAQHGFVTSPSRARVLRWFSRRRNGFARTDAIVLLRRGAIWRSLVIVPQARMQSVSLYQGPVLHVLRLASVRLHTVNGPIDARVGALDVDDATNFFREVADAAIRSSHADTSHRWRSAPPVTGTV